MPKDVFPSPDAIESGVELPDRFEVDSSSYEPESIGDSDFIPSPEQSGFLSSDARFRAFVGGVGTGKTTTSILAAFQASEVAKRGMLVAPNYTMVEEPLLSETKELARHLHGGIKKVKHSPPPKLVLANDSEILFRSADKPDTLRGPNIGFLGVDEAAMVSKEAWKVLIGRVRTEPEKAWVTTTPKGRNWVYEFFVENFDETKYWVQASTENAPWLSDDYVESLKGDYSEELRRQEMEGEFVSMGGNVFSYDDFIRDEIPSELGPTVVGIDPAGGGKDETGIVACCRKGETFFVLEDGTTAGRPNTWASAAVRLYNKWSADKIVAERQYGGDMVKEILSGIDPTVPVDDVPAIQGKRLRADPVIAKYEQGRVVHNKHADLSDLEEQMVTWDPDGNMSPDRFESEVYALRELITVGPQVESGVLFV